MFFNSQYILFVMLPGLLIGLWAQWKLHAAFGKYSQVPVESGLTGAQAARRILDQAGLIDMPVEEVEGRLSDHSTRRRRRCFCRPTIFMAAPSRRWAWRRTRRAMRCNISIRTQCSACAWRWCR